MTDFTSILQKPADEIEPPKQLPAGTYMARLSAEEFGHSNQKGTPFVRWYTTPIDAFSDVDTEELEEVKAQVEGDLSRRSMRMTFYLTENSLFRVRDFLRDTVGIASNGRNLEEMIPEAANQEIVISVAHGTSQNTGNVYAYVLDYASSDNVG